MRLLPRGRSCRPLTSAVALATCATLLASVPVAAEASGRRILDATWETGSDFSTGAFNGLIARGDSLRLGEGARQKRFRDVSGERRDAVIGSWTSPWVETPFGATEMIPSWRARTPQGSYVMLHARGRDVSGANGSWDRVARWASGDDTVLRRSGRSQADDLTSLATDTLRATAMADGRIAAWQLRISLVRAADARRVPALRSLSLVATRLPDGPDGDVSRPKPAGLATDLAVPRFSQMIHRGEYPQWGGGGQAWCSPTAISMLMAYWGRLPSAARWDWVDDAYTDPWIDHGARSTYDYAYNGAGNWAFTTAYAGTRLATARVTRLRNLRAAQTYIAAGVPIGISIAFDRGELSGAPISSTAGHLVVVRGFTASGDVIVNDPAAASNGSVRRIYDRGQLESAWQRSSGGLAYVVAPRRATLP